MPTAKRMGTTVKQRREIIHSKPLPSAVDEFVKDVVRQSRRMIADGLHGSVEVTLKFADHNTVFASMAIEESTRE